MNKPERIYTKMTVKKMSKQLFGTNGVRGIVGKEITPQLALRIGEALGTMRPGCIAVGMDTRTSGPALINAVKAGLMATGCDVVDCGILPTPALQYIVKGQYAGGAMITASHNPPEYNGIKIIEADGTEMGDEETIKLEGLLDKSTTLETQSWDRVGKETPGAHLVDTYVRSITSHFKGLPGKGITVVVDPGSGAACTTTPAILQALGCRVLTINGIMDGTFPGRLPEPSAEGLKGLAALVVASKAAFGIAHDGDADRAVFIDETGAFVEENHEFALIAQHICKTAKGTIVTPVSTSQMVEMVAEKEGCRVQYTPVGSIYVARTMRELIEAGEPVIFGGEGNGGLIFPAHQFCRDGGMTAATMVALLAETGSTLSELVRKLPARHMIKEKIATPHGSLLIDKLAEHYRHESIDRTDGLKIKRKNEWALIRASGTEPLVRIMVDSPDAASGRALYQEIRERVDKILKPGS
ncbi:phosphoglucosamine mutase [Methanoregula sp. UBA64]|jgi:phosphomannomutase / phosphoglucomutase|uniref:phosphoglucosamine mutase n=1 Tax=Methanoregula sp. UBA64 TaxID=1915554 RepID=UPI0025F0A469|nr:phosphoglucosamine mutase [Methanoregula sp. UBA64]